MARVLFLSDTHLGFDWPSRPRLERRRRGDDFYANTERALNRALQGDVDLVVHGGDLFHRSGVPLWVVERAYALLRKLADQGIPVAVVAGNHERARLPYPLLARHPRIFLFQAPTSVRFDTPRERIAVGGFPYTRQIRQRFRENVRATGLLHLDADVRLLCVHHCFEGARVGAHDWVFRDASDVVSAADIPRAIAAVLSGHVHRHQVLTRDLRGRPLAAPVVYAGSIERTSSAERGESKGFLLLDFEGNRLVRWQFEQLPARPLLLRTLFAGSVAHGPLEAQLARIVAEAPMGAVLLLRAEGRLSSEEQALLGAAALRRLVPATMNVFLRGHGETRSVAERGRRLVMPKLDEVLHPKPRQL
jgi:DNA repair protein SbcD/Mre11